MTDDEDLMPSEEPEVTEEYTGVTWFSKPDADEALVCGVHKVRLRRGPTDEVDQARWTPSLEDGSIVSGDTPGTADHAED